MKKRFVAFFLSVLFCAGFAASVSAYAAPIHRQEQLEEKWQALDENEKNEVYELLQKRAEDEIQLLKRLGELELLDPNIGEGVIKKLQEEISRSREAGELPGIFRHPPAPKERRN